MDFSILADQISHQDALDWIALITGVIYILLATKEQPSCWIFGIISSAAIAFKSFTEYKLIADGLLQVFYVVIGVAGLYNWLSGAKGNGHKPIVRFSWKRHVMVIFICLCISIPLSRLLIQYADTRFGYIDTSVTLLSIWATFLLVRKEIYNWIYWIILDGILVFLYFFSEAYLFSLLFVVYTIIAWAGWKSWKASYDHQIPLVRQ